MSVSECYDITIIGGGIVGLATAKTLIETFPSKRLLLIEKESTLAFHQTGHNSGVIHSGIYYKPGSLKATLSREGVKLLLDFCKKENVPYDICGKLIVATDESELSRLSDLKKRGIANGLQGLRELTKDEVAKREPHVKAVAALLVPETGIIDYKKVSEKYADVFKRAGGVILLGTKFKKLKNETDHDIIIATTTGDIQTKKIINCTGLYSDVTAKLCGQKPDVRIIPFKGEYFNIIPGKKNLVNHLIYPVPDPEFPFLGVHYTRMMDGTRDAGPNAVLSFKREGYRKFDFSVADSVRTFTFPGFYIMGLKYWRMGIGEMARSFSKNAFTKALQKMIPEITKDDLVPAHPGVRAQALTKEGKLVDDFKIISTKNQLHVLNAPSPAATASLAIAKHIVSYVKG